MGVLQPKVDEYQPRTPERLIEILRAWDEGPRAIRTEAADTIATLKSRAEQAESKVALLESNARSQATLLADTGRRVEELTGALSDCVGCVSAAEAEGLHETIAELRGFSEQTDRLIDLIERRLLWVRNYGDAALNREAGK